MRAPEVRDFSKRGDALPIPNLIDIQIESYQRFLQKEVDVTKRKNDGLEALLREVFPIESYDGNLKLEYISYELAEPRYTPDECRALRLTYGMPFRIRVRLARKDKDEVMEDSIYLGEVPIMIGGGEFIINGAERVIVSQLHRSPGVDFLVEQSEGDRPLHGCRIIPERGSWIECSVTKKDVLAVRIDQSSKIPATTFLRALDAKYGSTESIIKEFYQVESVKVGQLQPTYYAAGPIIDAETGEELVKAGAQLGEALGKIQGGTIAAGDSKKDEVIEKQVREYLKEFRAIFVPLPEQAEDAERLLNAVKAELVKEFDPPLNKIARETGKAADAGQEAYTDACRAVIQGNKGWSSLEDLEQKTAKGVAGIIALKHEGDLAYIGHSTDAQERVAKMRRGNESNVSFIKTIREELKEKGVDVTQGPSDGLLERIRKILEKAFPPLGKLADWVARLFEQIAKKFGGGARSGIPSVDVVTRASDPLILNTISEDTADSHEAALMKIYARLRPGNPPQLDKAKTLFQEKFFDENRYRLGRVGRFRINRKFDQNVPETVMTLRSEDLVNSLKYMFKLRAQEGYIDDIDHLGNRRLRTIDELASEELRKGFLKLRRTVQERMSLKDPNELGRIAELVNSKSISSAIDFFFGRGELSQVVDQTNPLSQLTHERRLSALGPGGLNRKRAGFEVRDVHISHYGRICPIETPEGTNIGLIASLAIYADIDDYGFLITPYRVVENGKVNGKHKYLRADEEMKSVLAPPDAVEKEGHLQKGNVLARVQGDLATVPSKDVQYIDISPRQTVSVSAALIPFLEHDDANRALMGSNMQRQAVPLLRTDPPVVATGMERPVAQNSGMVVRAERSGVVTYVDSMRILVDNADEYVLRKFHGLNERTCLNQKPIVRKGARVKKGQILADGPAVHQGELALGRNVLVAFMTFDGYNFEDAIVINQRLVKDDIFTSIHIEEYDVEIRETKLGREEFTRDIPNVSERALANLDENGVVRTGTRVGPGDILVGKVAPKSKSELTPEEKLLHAIFGRAGEDVKNDSLEMPAGEEGVVIQTQRFSRRMHMTDEQKKTLKKDMDKFEREMNLRAIEIFKQMIGEINDVTGQQMVDPNTKQKVAVSDNVDVVMEQIETYALDWVKGSKESKDQALNTYSRFWPRVQAVLKEKVRRLEHMKRGDELPSGVLEMVKVYVATKRQLSVGDKMAGRHGNKGVIARIVPEEDMPFLEDGTPVDIMLNPLGVPSRMNVGQILETHLGWAMKVLGQQAITPVFDGGTEDQIHEAIEQANKEIKRRRDDRKKTHVTLPDRELDVQMPWGGKVQLRDGRTGETLEQKTTVGYIYMMKLHHLVDDKIHARATGPYSLITQQPLGGKARTGGQRFGEMEVWGLEAYGAAYILQELLTVKSDDVEGRTKIYESMVKGTNTLEAGTPVSFDVLCNEIRGLGLNIQLEKKKGLGREDEDGDLM